MGSKVSEYAIIILHLCIYPKKNILVFCLPSFPLLGMIVKNSFLWVPSKELLSLNSSRLSERLSLWHIVQYYLKNNHSSNFLIIEFKVSYKKLIIEFRMPSIVGMVAKILWFATVVIQNIKLLLEFIYLFYFCVKIILKSLNWKRIDHQWLYFLFWGKAWWKRIIQNIDCSTCYHYRFR